MEQGKEDIPDILKSLVTEKKGVQLAQERTLRRPKKCLFFSCLSLACVSMFFLYLSSENSGAHLATSKNVVHSGTCAHSIFPSHFVSFLSHMHLYFHQSSLGFPLLFFFLIHPCHVHLARKGRGGVLHEKEVAHISARVIRFCRMSSCYNLSLQ